MDLVQRRKQLRQRQVDKVKKFRQSNMSASAAVQKQKEREEMKKEVRKEIEKETQKESMNIEHSNGTTFARVMDIIGPSHMRPLVSNGVWKGTEQISEKKSDCECDDCGQDPCIECGESHHSVKEAISRNYGSKTAKEGDNEAAAAARKRIYDRASAKDKDYMDAREVADQRNKKRYGTGEVGLRKEGVGAVLGAIGGGAIAAAGGVAAGAVKAGGSIAGAARDAAGKQKAAATRNKARQKKAEIDAANIETGNMESYNWRSDKTMRINKILNS